MKLLVTGAMGVIGSAAVRALVEAGHDVIALDVRDDPALVADLAGRFRSLQGDVTDLDELTERFHGLDCVVHLAAMIPPEADPYRGYATNAFGTVTVLEATRRAEVRRVVFSSSKAVYGSFDWPHCAPRFEPIQEEHPRRLMPLYPVYTSAKILSEDAGCIYADRFGIEFFALRFASIYGPGKGVRHDKGSGLHSRIIEGALRGESTVLASGADHFDDVIYVRDVAGGIVAACEAQKPPCWAFNIGSGKITSLQEFVDVVRAEVGGDVAITLGPGNDPTGSGSTGYGLLDSSRANQWLGYTAKYDFVAAVRDYIATVTH